VGYISGARANNDRSVVAAGASAREGRNYISALGVAGAKDASALAPLGLDHDSGQSKSPARALWGMENGSG
jgi:hypothetical protein